MKKIKIKKRDRFSIFFADEKYVDFDVNTAENANDDVPDNDFFVNIFVIFFVNIFEHDNEVIKLLSFLKYKIVKVFVISFSNMYRFIGFWCFTSVSGLSSLQ